MVSLDSLHTTLLASIRSVGTAVTLAAVGFYLHQRGCIVGDGKKTLAVICQQVQFPLFLFTKILYCNQNWSTKACPDVTSSLRDAWLLLFWPVYVVGMGFLVGYGVAKITKTPPIHVRAVLASCAFPNNTALPITLLTVISSNFPADSNLGSIDPTLFLSVYLLVYPVLQWGIGGWLLAPEEEKYDKSPIPQGSLQCGVDGFNNSFNEDSSDENRDYEKRSLLTPHHSKHKSGSLLQVQQSSGTKNVLNNAKRTKFFKAHRRGLTSNDEGCYISELDLNSLWKEHDVNDNHEQIVDTPAIKDIPSQFACASYQHSRNGDARLMESQHSSVSNGGEDYKQLVRASCTTTHLGTNDQAIQEAKTLAASIGLSQNDLVQSFDETKSATNSWSTTLWNVLERCLFQPPVIGALLGILCACYTPLRSLFVDLSRQSNAPLQWLFDGLYQVGQTAVPTNMMILGCNLSAGKIFRRRDVANVEPNHEEETFSMRTMVGMIIGKQIILPIIGIISTIVLKEFILNIPPEISGAFYLVIVIVFLTPTANNVMVMIELSGSSTDAFATVIALQYAFAPILLSLTLTIAIGVASGWS